MTYCFKERERDNGTRRNAPPISAAYVHAEASCEIGALEFVL